MRWQRVARRSLADGEVEACDGLHVFAVLAQYDGCIISVRPHSTFLVPPDLRTLDFAGFIALVFDHPAYEGIDVELDGNR
ncbi:MAG: hypothetical protein ABIT20_06000, partial [Gemmatimonadaceae bacterium]